MGQFDVLEWLVDRRKRADDSFFTSEQIYHGLKESGQERSRVAVRRNLFPLCSFRLVDLDVQQKRFNIERRYRASEKALKELSFGACGK